MNNFLLLSLIDVLFLPFLRPLPITLSLIPVLIWNLKNISKFYRKLDTKLSLAFVFLAFLSVLYSIIVFRDEDIDIAINNIFLFGLILIFFLYLFLFRQNSQRHIEQIRRILEIYLYFNLALSALYWYDYLYYFLIRTFWTFSGNLLSIGDFSIHTRFTGTFSDPNNAAAAIIMIYSYLFSTMPNIKKFIIYSIMVFIIIISTMSTTGFIALLFSSTILSIYVLLKNSNSIYTYIIIILSIPFVLICFNFINESTIYNLSIERIVENDGGGRHNIAASLLYSKDFLYTFFIGSGGTIFIDGEKVKPHIGHLHIIFNYSFYAWVIFIYTVFRVRQKKPLISYLPIFIFLVGFSINTGIIDFRFTVIASLLVALYMIEPLKESSKIKNI